MLVSAAAKPRSLDLFWRALSALRCLPRNGVVSHEPRATSADALPAARLRDLEFEADQVGGSIDFAKGQHQRFF